MTKFNNLKVKRVKSNLKYTESKLVKKKNTVKARNSKKSHHHLGITQKKATRKEASRKKGSTQRGITQKGNTQKGIAKKAICKRASRDKFT